MGWLERNAAKRIDPQLVLDGARSVITLATSYGQADDAPANPSHGVIARYARYADYHDALAQALGQLTERVQSLAGEGIPFALVRRYRADPRARPWPTRRPWLHRQTHQPHQPPARQLVFHLRNPHHRRAGAGRAGTQPLRQMHKLHRRLPDQRDHRAVPTRRPPLHLLFDHRVERRDPGGVSPRDRQPDLRLRRLPRRLSVEPLRRRGPLDGAAPARRPWPSRLDRVAVAGRRRFPGQVSRHADAANQAPRRAAKRLRGAGQRRRRHSTPAARARRCRPRAPHRRARPMGPWPSAAALRSEINAILPFFTGCNRSGEGYLLPT